MIVGHAIKMIEVINEFKDKNPGCVNEVFFETMLEKMLKIQKNGDTLRGKDNDPVKYLESKAFKRHLEHVLKLPEQPVDDPALAFVPKKKRKGKKRNDFLWQPDGMDALIGKFSIIYQRHVSKNKIQPVESMSHRGGEYWLVTDMVATLHKHCLKGDKDHPFYRAVIEAGKKCGKRIMELQPEQLTLAV